MFEMLQYTPAVLILVLLLIAVLTIAVLWRRNISRVRRTLSPQFTYAESTPIPDTALLPNLPREPLDPHAEVGSTPSAPRKAKIVSMIRSSPLAPVTDRLHAMLVVERGHANHDLLRLTAGRDTLIGRKPDADLVLRDNHV